MFIFIFLSRQEIWLLTPFHCQTCFVSFSWIQKISTISIVSVQTKTQIVFALTPNDQAPIDLLCQCLVQVKKFSSIKTKKECALILWVIKTKHRVESLSWAYHPKKSFYHLKYITWLRSSLCSFTSLNNVKNERERKMCGARSSVNIQN